MLKNLRTTYIAEFHNDLMELLNTNNNKLGS